jgi:hypothetical protein
MWFKLFNTDYFRITIVDDAHTVELCGALKVKFNGFFKGLHPGRVLSHGASKNRKGGSKDKK